MTSLTDEELLALMATGDENAFVALYRRRQGSVYRFALQMCGSESIAEEVSQEVFLALIRESGQYDPARGSVAAYLYGVARNHVLRRLEKDRPYVAMPEETSDERVAPDDPLAELARHEDINAVRRAVLSLPASYREVVVLCDLHEMSYADASAVLRCAVGTVRSRLHRGRALLAEKLRGKPRVAGETRSTAAPGHPAKCFI